MVSSTLSKAILAAAVGAASVQAVCTYSWQASKGDTCQTLSELWGISLAQFQQYNPSAACPALTAGTSYCVEWDYGQAPTTTAAASTTAKPTTTTPKTTTTTTSKAPASTGPALPSPTQDGLASTCKSFYMVSSGDSCAAIVSKYNTFSLTDL